MSLRKLARLSDRIGKPLSLRYEPDHRFDDGPPADHGSGPWAVVVDTWTKADTHGRGFVWVRQVDALARAGTPAAAVSGATRAVDRRLADAAERYRDEED